MEVLLASDGPKKFTVIYDLKRAHTKDDCIIVRE